MAIYLQSVSKTLKMPDVIMALILKKLSQEEYKGVKDGLGYIISFWTAWATRLEPCLKTKTKMCSSPSRGTVAAALFACEILADGQ